MIFLLTLIAMIQYMTHYFTAKGGKRHNLQFKESLSLPALTGPPIHPPSLLYLNPATHWE